MTPPTLADILLGELERDPSALEALADRLAPLLAGRFGESVSASPWLNAEEAARYLACSRDRLYDLVQLRKVTAHRDGRRLLFRRTELDAYLGGP